MNLPAIKLKAFETLAIVPADGRQKALVFFPFDDNEDPNYEVVEHPIVAWRIQPSTANMREALDIVAVPVIPVDAGMHTIVGVLYEDGRVSVPFHQMLADRKAFEGFCVDEHHRYVEDVRATATAR